MVTPEIAASSISTQARHGRPLRVFWVSVADGREEFAAELRESLDGHAVVPVVLRGQVFLDPDSVMGDVADILKGNREEIHRARSVAIRQGGVDLVLLSRRELRLANTSSPIVLPEWFPVDGGRMVTVTLYDLTWNATVPLNHESSQLGDLHRLLHELEGVLVARLEKALKRDKRLVQAFWDLTSVDGNSPGSMSDELGRIGAALEMTQNPESYRPSTRYAESIVGRIWAHTNRTTPDRLERTAKALATALEQDAGSEEMSLAAVLSRPTKPIGDMGVRWSLGLAVTVRAGCQLVTAAAHASEYPAVSATLLKSTSLDICEFLNAAVAKLRT